MTPQRSFNVALLGTARGRRGMTPALSFNVELSVTAEGGAT